MFKIKSEQRMSHAASKSRASASYKCSASFNTILASGVSSGASVFAT